VPAGTINRDPAHIIDFMPTFLEIAGGAYPKTFGENEIIPAEGRSMLPLLRGQSRPAPKFLAWEWSGNRAYREGDMKVVWDKGTKQWALFDLGRDRTEMNDLADAQPELARRLSDAWFAWDARTRMTAVKKSKRKPSK
jgi:arylsulfatase